MQSKVQGSLLVDYLDTAGNTNLVQHTMHALKTTIREMIEDVLVDKKHATELIQ